MVTTSSSSDPPTVSVLVTGANSGLGFAICCRLIDEFLLSRPSSQSLRLLFSTRDKRKGTETLQRLKVHLNQSLRKGKKSIPSEDSSETDRIRLQNVLVDLTRLTTVQALAEELLSQGLPLDAVIWNAGIAGWLGLNWPQAIYHVLTDLVHSVTYPTYPICDVGLAASVQIEDDSNAGSEPKLGQVFLSNVFGHYMLTHWLSPLFSNASRVIWISSISALSATFSPDDIQGFTSDVAYEGSKRLTDMLVLTSDLPSTRPYVDKFLPNKARRPRMIVTHPGVIGTSIAGLHWTLALCMLAACYLARWLGSPWHLVTPYKGAVSATFCALAPASQLDEREQREGKGKWGSAVNVFGEERVGRTEVEGWGFSGVPDAIPPGSITNRSGQYRYRQPTTTERRNVFEDDSRQVWRQMEELRLDWEKRLGSLSVKQNGQG